MKLNASRTTDSEMPTELEGKFQTFLQVLEGKNFFAGFAKDSNGRAVIPSRGHLLFAHRTHTQQNTDNGTTWPSSGSLASSVAAPPRREL